MKVLDFMLSVTKTNLHNSTSERYTKKANDSVTLDATHIKNSSTSGTKLKSVPSKVNKPSVETRYQPLASKK